jgi:hypothetical protein
MAAKITRREFYSDCPDLRDVCATAGSFDKCMEIKMG